MIPHNIMEHCQAHNNVRIILEAMQLRRVVQYTKPSLQYPEYAFNGATQLGMAQIEEFLFGGGPLFSTCCSLRKMITHSTIRSQQDARDQ